jgi:hypothetical protein
MTYQEPDPQFSALRKLLAEKRQEIPVDTEVNRFLIELHRRQRAQLLRQQEAGLFGRIAASFLELGQRALSPLPYVAAGACLVTLFVLTGPAHNTTINITPHDNPTNPAPVLASVDHPRTWNSEHMISLFSDGNRHLAADLGKLSENLNVPKLNLGDVTPRFVMANSRVNYDTQASF